MLNNVCAIEAAILDRLVQKLDRRLFRLVQKQLQILGEIDPTVCALLPESKESALEMLVNSFICITMGLRYPEVMEDGLRQIGVGHRLRGIDETQIQPILHSLHLALKQELAEDWTEEVEDAWRRYSSQVETAVLTGLREAA